MTVSGIIRDIGCVLLVLHMVGINEQRTTVTFLMYVLAVLLTHQVLSPVTVHCTYDKCKALFRINLMDSALNV